MAVKTLPFRIYAQIFIFSALVALGAIILWPLQRAVQTGIIGIRDYLITSIEYQIGRKIQYSSISPSLFGSFDVRGVSVLGKDDLPVLSMSRFRIAYSLPNLLRGKIQAIHSIRVDSPIIDFNTARDYDLIEVFEYFWDGREDTPRNLTAMFPEKLLVRIRNGRCFIINHGDMFEIDALNFDIEIANNRMVVLGGWDTGLTIEQLIGEPIFIYVSMKVDGSCDTAMKEGEAVLSIPSIIGDARSSGPIAFDLVLENGVVHMGKMPDALSFAVSLEYGIRDKTIDARLECAGFKLRDFISFSGGLEGLSPLLDIAGSGMASFERNADGSLGYSIDLSGAALSPPVSAAAFRPSRVERASFTINVIGDEQRAEVNTLHLSMPQAGRADAFFGGSLGFAGSIGLKPFAPDGVFSLTHFTLSGSDMVNAQFAVNSREGGEIAASTKTLEMGKVEFADFIAAFKPLESDTYFTVSAARSMGRPGSLSLEGSLNSEQRLVRAGIKLNSFSVGEISGIALPLVKDASLLPVLKGLRSGSPLDSEVVFTISGRDHRVELNEGRFTQGKETLLLSGGAEYTGQKDLNFNINAAYHDLDYLVEGRILNGKSIAIRGSHDLDISLVSAGKGYSGSMRAGGFPIPFLGNPALLFFAARLRYDSVDSWSMNLEQFELTGISGPAGPSQIRISGGVDQRGGDFPVLYYRDKIGPLDGRAEISWAEDYAGFTGTVIMRDGLENYHAEGSLNDGHFNFVFSGSAMRLERLFGGKVNARARGDLHLSGDSIDSFRAEINIASIDGRIFEQEFETNIRAVLDSNELLVNSFNFRFEDLHGTVSHFMVSGTRGILGSRTEIKGFAGERPVKGNMSLSADFTPIQSWLEIDRVLSSLSGTAHVEGFSYGAGGEARTFDIVFSQSNGAVTVSGGPRNMIRFQMDNDGNFYAGLSSPFPVRGTVIGSIKNKMINARCGDLYVDAGELFNILPRNDEFYLTGGYLNASMDIRGPVTDPEFFGSARGTSLRIRIPDFVTNELRPIPFTIVIEGNEMRFGPVPVASGSGAGTVNGRFLVNRWIPDVYNLDINIPRETPVPYGFDITGFVARGDASGKLKVSMENTMFDISGELHVNNTELGINSNEMNQSRNVNTVSQPRTPLLSFKAQEIKNIPEPDVFPQPKIPFVLNLLVSTGPVVEFIYPQSRLPILRATPEIGSRIRVTANSLARQYTLTSDVKIRGGEIYYFDRSFYIRSGTLILRENETIFWPLLTARAEVRDRTEDGPVTISMIVDNAPLFDFIARFESSPSLSQMEIFTLLGQNITGTQPDESANSIMRTTLSSTFELATQFVIGRQLEQQLRNFLQLDMFSVRTQFIQNYLFMATGLFEHPVDRIGIGNYFDNTTVYGGKYIGQDMFVQGMLSMRYDANNTSTGGIIFVPDIGIELQNPLFSIRWDFVPTHPENWYVNDNSITLTKSWTF